MKFASRALTGSERNYQNLEREWLAMIWGMEKFHYFLYGKKFTLETDQKALALIYKKHMVEIYPRIQRLIVRSFPYQPFNVQYRKFHRQLHSTCYTINNGRGWNSAAHHSSELSDSKHSIQFQ